MNRRKFIVGTAAAGAGAIASLSQLGAQVPSAPPVPAPTGRGRGSAAQVAPERLARIGMMTLNHSAILKLPWNANPTPVQTLDLMDLPQYYVDVYGVRNVEFQHGHLAQNQDSPDPEVFKALKAKFDAVGSKANQINCEIGSMARMTPEGKAVGLDPEARAAWLVRGKKWADVAPLLGIKRLMLNQGALTEDSRPAVASLWKELADYARPKGLIVSNEARGSGAPVYTLPRAGGPGAPAAPAAPPAAPVLSEPERLRYVWGILGDTAADAGGYTNLDWGGAGRFKSQQQLNDGIKGLLKTNSGNMHVKSSPDWDIASTVRYAESIGYKGLYTIEVSTDPVIRIVYNTILAGLAQV